MSRSAFFVSDLHLGALFSKANENRDSHFIDFLESLTERASHLFILGDLFEFWMEYRHFIPKDYFRVLVALKTLCDKGVEVHYLSGNHDFNLGEFFGRELNITIHTGPYPIELQGKRLLLLHGDGMDPEDHGYHVLKKIMCSAWANKFFQLLHPDFGMALALWFGKQSRTLHGNIPRHLERYEKATRQLLQAGYDIVMHGHIHAGFVKQLPEGIYVNSGEWLVKMQYVEMADGVCTLKNYVVS